MRVFGLTITRRSPTVRKNAVPFTDWSGANTGGWWPMIRESFAGAWQRGIVVERRQVLSYSTVFACITLIAADIAKLWVNLVEEDADGICTPVENPVYSPVLRKPNRYSTWLKFIEFWIICKFSTGNAYVLKQRGNKNAVTALYVLDPSRVQVLVAPDGAVFYQLGTDHLAGIEEASVRVPASEIIHDICVPMFHPLCGVSPIFACGLAATQGLKILESSTRLFANNSQPGGVLSAPGNISDETAKRLKEHWDANYAGESNIGKLVVLGDGLEYEPMTMTAVDAEVVDQLKLTDERICATFHVPGYMVGVGAPPPYTDIQSINLQDYTQALQNPIENLETLLVEGLELRKGFGIEFDLAALSRMDQKTQMAIAKDGVGGGILTPNEARADMNRKPLEGGKSAFLQQQMFSLEALAKRDAANPAPATVASATPTPAPSSAQEPAKPPAASTGGEPAAATTLNGAQVTALLQILEAVAQGQLPRATGVNAIMVAFGVDSATAEALMGDVGAGFVPTPDTPPPDPTAAQAEPTPEADDKALPLVADETQLHFTEALVRKFTDVDWTDMTDAA